jgi:REP element-mobilizing transposase RayT
MARAMKQGQQTFEFRCWGGKRKGAGRPPKAPRSSERHKARLRFHRPTPVHVTLRVVAPIGTLRRRAVYQAILRAMAVVLGRSDFRIVHISLEDDHVHLICEAETHTALASGMKAFQSSAAQRLNQVISEARGRKRRGQVFADRYHAVLIKSPTQARNAIAYVVNNWRRHRKDGGLETRFWDVDYFSSGPSFPGWSELEDSPLLYEVPKGYDRLPVARPHTWLLSKGWAKAGSISMRQIPGQR